MPHTALHPNGPAPTAEHTHPAVLEFMHDLRTLRTENGAPSYATVSNRTGLPRSTVYDALRRDRLPALDTTMALIAAFGADRADWRRRWTEVRALVDEPSRPSGGPDDELVRPNPSGRTNPDGVDTNSTGPGSRRRPGRRGLIAAGIVLALAAGSATYLAWPDGSSCRPAQLYTVTSAGDLLNATDQTVGRVQPGDTVEVLNHKHDAYAHRLRGTVERTGDTGYVDEARIDPARTVCA